MASLEELKAKAQQANPYLAYDTTTPEKEAAKFIVKTMLLKDLTHETIAEKTGVDLKKVQHIQAGAISIQDEDVQTVYDYCVKVYEQIK